MSNALPQLRPLEVFPVQHNGAEVICLRDPTGFTGKLVTVSRSALLILDCLDGRAAAADIQARVLATTGQEVTTDLIERFIAQLDQALLLDSPRFARHRAGLIAAFRNAPDRAAAHAGRSYPATAPAIRELLEPQFRKVNPPTEPPPRALVSPHIDPRTAGPTYAHAYSQLTAPPTAAVYVILGVAHQPTGNRFVGTTKDFVTPLGRLATDREFMAQLAGSVSFDLCADEFAHRQEHSIEFQALHLQHALGATATCRIAPILVGSFQDLMQAGEDPRRDRQVETFIAALRAAVAGHAGRVCVIAGIDLAHVGGRFGDEFTVNADVREELAQQDRRMLAHVERLDPDGLWRAICEEGDRRRVDGYPALFTLLNALDLTTGRLLDYGQSFEPNTNSVVSFASLRFD